jgi:serine/threonine protein kinase/tetratricopeptide (TPR) repeat protein
MEPPAAAVDVAGSVTLDDDPTNTRVGARPSRTALPSGSTVGRYVLLRPLGQGGAGVVYEAFDPELGRGVAIKVLHAEPGGAGDTGTLQGRLLLEAQAMAKVRHPNVMPVHDAGTFDGQVFVAMELVEGGTLRRWLTTTTRSRKEILRVFLAAGRGLAAAHAAGLVHRDFKPDNVMIGAGTTGEQRVLVTDFGLVQAAFRDASSNATPHGDVEKLAELRSTHPPPALGSTPSIGNLSAPRVPTVDGLTETGSLLGTPGFMAPEQILLGPVSPASDQFAFCVSLLEALSGGRVFPGKTLMDRLNATIDGKPSRGPTKVPARIVRALERGLAGNPRDRWPSMDDLLAELARDPVAAARPWLVFGGLSLGVLAAALGVSRATASRSEQCNGATAHLDGVWDDGVRARVEAAFGKLPFASQSLRTIEAKLDGYAGAWASMHTEACLAGVRGEQAPEVQTLRMQCLGERLASLRATTALLASADRDVATKAIDLTTGLPRIDRCADVEALRAPVPLPDDAGTRAKIQSLRERLEGLRADLLAGKVAPSVPRAQAFADEARVIAYAPLTADALFVAGLAEQMSGAFKDAEPTLEESARVADLARADHTRAEALVKLTFVVGYGLARRPDGLRWGRLADAAVARVRDRALEGDEAFSLAVTYLEAGDRAKTLEEAQRAVAIDEEVLGADNLSTVKAVNVLGAAYDQARDSAAAERTYQRALAT